MDELIWKSCEAYMKYEELLLKRDQLLKDARSIHIAYMKEFGDLMLEVYEMKIECIKKKKMIAFCQTALNHCMPIDLSEVKNYIERAMVFYNRQLQEMLADRKQAEGAKRTPDYKVERAKRTYRRLAKTLHPDINPEVVANPEIAELWTRITVAYHCNDDVELENLEILARRVLKACGMSDVPVEITNISERIERLEEEINAILTSEPYIFEEFLTDPEKFEMRKEMYRKELAEYRAYSQELADVLRKMLIEGGAEFVWIEN
ncbi:MAG: hypothetical protein J5636_03225 [Clostridiales bacterium]|nr:hypothetical protein [Clostridiales bacterium]